MRRARSALAGVVALALGSVAASAQSADGIALPHDPRVDAAVAAVSAIELRRTDERLVAFGTRNLFSETQHSKTRGVYAARDWLASRFRALGLSVTYDTYVQPKTADTPRAVEVSSVIATLRGDDPARGTIVVSSHYDSRNSDGNDATRDAPGADDNGSGTAAVLEAARVLATTHVHATVVFACFDGEEQGLFGSDHYAASLAARGTRVEANLNNDIIGASVGHDGEREPNDVRLFSEALPVGSVVRRTNLLGDENDAPARELARFAKETGEAYVPTMHVDLVARADRFLRGGDQESFAAHGDPAVRFVEPHENFDHQHQNVRTEGGTPYGDLVAYMDYDYLARVTQLDVADAATLALAPPAPSPKLLAKHLGYDSTLAWDAVPGAASYDVVWRATTDATWTHAKNVGATTTATLPLSKDDWLFGVRAVDATGRRSVVGFPIPLR